MSIANFLNKAMISAWRWLASLKFGLLLFAWTALYTHIHISVLIIDSSRERVYIYLCNAKIIFLLSAVISLQCEQSAALIENSRWLSFMPYIKPWNFYNSFSSIMLQYISFFRNKYRYLSINSYMWIQYISRFCKKCLWIKLCHITTINVCVFYWEERL